MKLSHLISILQSNYSTIGATFTNGGREYTYKCKEAVEVGDIVLVPASDGGLPKAVTVVRVDTVPVIDTEADFVYKWVIQKVDLTAYEELQRQEAEFAKAYRLAEQHKQRENTLADFRQYLPEGAVPALDDAVKALKGGE